MSAQLRDVDGTLAGHWRYAPPYRYRGATGTFDRHGKRTNLNRAKLRLEQDVRQGVVPERMTKTQRRKLLKEAREYYG